MSAGLSIENLDGLIRKIQEEGVERARAEAEGVLLRAEEGARAIRSRAEQEARDLLERAREELELEKQQAARAMELAARDTLLAVREQLIGLFNRVLAETCRERLSGEALDAFLVKVALAWDQAHPGKDLEVWVSKEDAERLFQTALAGLQETLRKGVEIRGHPDVRAGLRLSHKGDSVQFDFSDAAMAEVLSGHVSHRFAGLWESWMKRGGTS